MGTAGLELSGAYSARGGGFLGGDTGPSGHDVGKYTSFLFSSFVSNASYSILCTLSIINSRRYLPCKQDPRRSRSKSQHEDDFKDPKLHTIWRSYNKVPS